MRAERKHKRQCAACREYRDKEELIRITRDSASGEIKVNQEGKYHGRSVYICKNKECVDKIIRNKKTEALLRREITEKIKEEVYTVLKN